MWKKRREIKNPLSLSLFSGPVHGDEHGDNEMKTPIHFIQPETIFLFPSFAIFFPHSTRKPNQAAAAANFNRIKMENSWRRNYNFFWERIMVIIIIAASSSSSLLQSSSVGSSSLEQTNITKNNQLPKKHELWNELEPEKGKQTFEVQYLNWNKTENTTKFSMFQKFEKRGGLSLSLSLSLSLMLCKVTFDGGFVLRRKKIIFF